MTEDSRNQFLNYTYVYIIIYSIYIYILLYILYIIIYILYYIYIILYIYIVSCFFSPCKTIERLTLQLSTVPLS